MTRLTKILVALFVISAIIAPIYAQQEPCDKCKANPESCQLLQTGKCDDCSGEKKIVEKKIIVLSPNETRGFLGVQAINKDEGVVVEKVVSNSPAEKAGIAKGDVITEIKGTKVKTQEELIGVLSKTKPEDMVEVKIKSADKVKTLEVKLGEAPKMSTKITATVSPEGKTYKTEKEMMMPMGEMTCPEYGSIMPPPPCCPMMDKCPMMTGKGTMMMEKEMPMTKEIEKQFIVMPAKETRGFLGVVTAEEDGKLVVQRVVPNSPAEKAGIKENDVITEINGTAVTTPAELIDALQNTKPGDVAHFKILSGSTEKMMDITLGEVPAPTQSTMPSMQMRMKMRGEGAGAGYFGPGFTFFKYDDLNTLFAQHGMDLIEKQQFIFGGGGWGQPGRIRIGGFGFGGTQTVSNDTLDVEVSYGAGFFEMGYNIVNAKHFMLTPIIGIGGSGLTMKITSLLYNPVNLDNVLNYPGGVAKVTTGGFSMFPGLAIDIPIGFAGLSLKGGYMWTPMKNSWIMEDFGKIHGPTLNLNGPFVMMNIMFGGGGTHKHK